MSNENFEMENQAEIVEESAEVTDETQIKKSDLFTTKQKIIITMVAIIIALITILVILFNVKTPWCKENETKQIVEMNEPINNDNSITKSSSEKPMALERAIQFNKQTKQIEELVKKHFPELIINNFKVIRMEPINIHDGYYTHHILVKFDYINNAFVETSQDNATPDPSGTLHNDFLINFDDNEMELIGFDTGYSYIEKILHYFWAYASYLDDTQASLSLFYETNSAMKRNNSYSINTNDLIEIIKNATCEEGELSGDKGKSLMTKAVFFELSWRMMLDNSNNTQYEVLFEKGNAMPRIVARKTNESTWDVVMQGGDNYALLAYNQFSNVYGTFNTLEEIKDAYNVE